MLRIRLQRVGRKHEPVFRVVLTESQNSSKSGRVLEVLGSYDPRFNKKAVKADRVKHWISVGAKPTDTVHNILVSEKVVAGKKINVLPKKAPILKEGAATEASPVAAAAPVAQVEAAPAETPAETPSAEATPAE